MRKANKIMTYNVLTILFESYKADQPNFWQKKDPLL